MIKTLQKTMQAAAIDQFGGPETLRTRELPTPEAGHGEVLIQVESAGVGVWDPFEIRGGFEKMFGGKSKFPYVPGSDCAGTVAAVGKGVRGYKEGDKVYAFSLKNPKGGSYAEYCAIKEDMVSLIPGRLSTESAGAMPICAVTALEGLENILKLKKDETVLILGASGGIGHLAVQLAKRMGARVFAVASGEDGVELCQKLGADIAIDGHNANIAESAKQFTLEGFDTALLTAGGESATQALECLRQGGRAAYPNGVEPEPKAPSGVKLKSYDGMPNKKVIERLNHLIESGPFEVHIAQTFPLDQAADALKALNSHFIGKIVMRPNP